MEDTDIRELLPQRDPFVMVDRLVHYDPVVTETCFTPAADCIFVSDGCLSAPGVVENMAQTCAARMGWISRQADGPVRIGVIGAVNGFRILRQPRAGELLTTRIEVLQEVFDVTLVHASVMSDGCVLAESDLKIALTDIGKNE